MGALDKKTGTETTLNSIGVTAIGAAVPMMADEPIVGIIMIVVGATFIYASKHYRNVSVPVSVDDVKETAEVAKETGSDIADSVKEDG